MKKKYNYELNIGTQNVTVNWYMESIEGMKFEKNGNPQKHF